MGWVVIGHFDYIFSRLSSKPLFNYNFSYIFAAMTRLTKGEEEVMQAIWEIGRGSAGDVREVLAKAGNEAKPTTVSTVLRILVDKGFLKFEAFGRTYVYEPAVAKTDYSASRLTSFIERFFGGSPAQLVSFLAQREDLSLTQIEALLDQAQTEVPGETSGDPEHKTEEQ